ncbi:hypothetical protein niasHS_011651 [Heterodera schachtii]|uniref:Uncharacterized protein n=1 Tax=Heterodera schachtii TaxID=97005 RepID=A0ABD2ITG0_HETSC
MSECWHHLNLGTPWRKCANVCGAVVESFGFDHMLAEINQNRWTRYHQINYTIQKCRPKHEGTFGAIVPLRGRVVRQWARVCATDVKSTKKLKMHWRTECLLMGPVRSVLQQHKPKQKQPHQRREGRGNGQNEGTERKMCRRRADK